MTDLSNVWAYSQEVNIGDKVDEVDGALPTEAHPGASSPDAGPLGPLGSRCPLPGDTPPQVNDNFGPDAGSTLPYHLRPWPFNSPNACTTCGASASVVTRPEDGDPYRQCPVCGQIQLPTFVNLDDPQFNRRYVLPRSQCPHKTGEVS